MTEGKIVAVLEVDTITLAAPVASGGSAIFTYGGITYTQGFTNNAADTLTALAAQLNGGAAGSTVTAAGVSGTAFTITMNAGSGTQMTKGTMAGTTDSSTPLSITTADTTTGVSAVSGDAGGNSYTQAFVTSHQDTLDALVVKINASEADYVAKRVGDGIVFTSTKTLVPLPVVTTSGTTDGTVLLTHNKTNTAASTGTNAPIDMFETLNAMHKALDTNNSVEIRNTLDKINSVHEHVILQQAKLGSRVQRLESLSIAIEDRDYTYQVLKSGLEDLDYVAAASRLSNQTLALQAGQQTFAQLSGLSLFKYIS